MHLNVFLLPLLPSTLDLSLCNKEAPWIDQLHVFVEPLHFPYSIPHLPSSRSSKTLVVVKLTQDKRFGLVDMVSRALELNGWWKLPFVVTTVFQVRTRLAEHVAHIRKMGDSPNAEF